MLFLELKAKAHSDIDIIVELLDGIDNSESYEIAWEDKVNTKYKVRCKNRGATLYSAPNKDDEKFEIKNNTEFELRITEALYNKLFVYHYPEGEIILIRFVTENVKNKFWKIEKAQALPQQVNNDIELDEDYEKQKIKNNFKRRSILSTTDDRIGWAVAINNATKLVADINTDIDKKITLIEENTPRLFELVKSLETYLTKPEEKNNEKEEEKDPWDESN